MKFSFRPLKTVLMLSLFVFAIGESSFLTAQVKDDSDKAAETDESELEDHLLFYSSFDGTTTADFAKGESELFTAENMKNISSAKAGLHDPAVTLAVGKGLSGDALEFTSKKRKRTFYKSANNIAYDEKSFSGSISFWLQIDPAKDLEPGFCDPIQITDSRYNDAAFWVDFTKENPRDFRLGVIGDLDSWNPEKKDPHSNPEFEKRLIPIKDPEFSRERWSHVVINFDGLNSDSGKTQFYFDGKLKGELEMKDPFTWEIDKSNILLGLSYIGLFDELAVFDRPLSEAEVARIHSAKGGLKSTLKIPEKAAQ